MCGHNRSGPGYPPVAAAPKLSRRAASRSVSRSSTNPGTWGDTSPPYDATSLTSEDDTKPCVGLAGRKTVSTPGASPAFIWAICSS